MAAVPEQIPEVEVPVRLYAGQDPLAHILKYPNVVMELEFNNDAPETVPPIEE